MERTETKTAESVNDTACAQDSNAEKAFNDPLGHVKFTSEECDERLLQGIYQTASLFLESAKAIKPRIKDGKLKDTVELEYLGIKRIADDAVRIMRTKSIEPKAPGFFTRASARMRILVNSIFPPENRRIAEMAIESCAGGICVCIENIYDFQKADTEIKTLCEDLMHILEKYLDSMKYFLTH